MQTALEERWFPYLVRRAAPRRRLFCLPYAGGGASTYRHWQQALPDDVEVWAIQLPGRENRFGEAAYSDVAALLPTIAESLHPVLGEMPYALFGHSMGAMLAFELAHTLQHYGMPAPNHLFASAFRAPHLPNRHPLIHDLPTDRLIAALRTMQGTPEEVLQHAELMELLMPLLRADLRMAETYRYHVASPLPCPISVFGGVHDNEIQQRELDAWRVHTTHHCSIHLFPGNHFFIETAQSLLLTTIVRDWWGGNAM